MPAGNRSGAMWITYRHTQYRNSGTVDTYLMEPTAAPFRHNGDKGMGENPESREHLMSVSGPITLTGTFALVGKQSGEATMAGKPVGPSAPAYIVRPLDFCVASTNLLTSRLCVIDFDQCFQKDQPPARIVTPAIYMAPEVAIEHPYSEASDIWALGCVIFRMRSSEDIFLDYDTCCPSQVLQQIECTIGDLPDGWAMCFSTTMDVRQRQTHHLHIGIITVSRDSP